MKDGFIKVKAISHRLVVGDVEFNKREIINEIIKAEKENVKILTFPELALSSMTCEDMLRSDVILNACERALVDIKNATQSTDILCFVGTPVRHGNNVFSSVAVLKSGELLCVIPKDTGIVYEETVLIDNESYPFSTSTLFRCRDIPDLVVGALVGDLARVPMTNDCYLCEGGATIIANPSSSYELVSSEEIRECYFKSRSFACACAFVVANPSCDESTSKNVYSAHNLIAENGDILAESKAFERKTGECVSEIDVSYLKSKRREAKLYDEPTYTFPCIDFTLKIEKTSLTRKVSNTPFFPEGKREQELRCEKILTMQSRSLAKRLIASYSRTMVLGISGGLDSTLALLACVRCADYLGWDRKSIVAVTMPCFGTTKRTKSNATLLCNALGVTLKEINIGEAVSVHLRDIGHDIENRNVTYENAQARERTQVLMDVANDIGGLVIGTGDLSEEALGWATYNGDHMSMYNVNFALPKTLIRHVVSHYAATCTSEVRAVLLDILDTPVSPELLPASEGGEIKQKTEDLVGPYELHDFFIYNFVGRGFSPSKTYRLALHAFEGKYDEEIIEKWLRVFIKRFFAQQFKRSCSPDGVRIGSVSLSREDFKMPSDFSASTFLSELDNIKR